MLSKEQIDQIKSMTECRCTQAKIAETVGCSITTVKNYQKKMDFPASNRHGDGKEMHSAIPPVFESKGKKAELIEEVEDPNEPKPNEWIAVADKTVTLIGLKTNYIYTIGLKNDSVVIDTGYNDVKIEIDLKDMVAFGNELLDVVNAITKMKKNVWSV